MATNPIVLALPQAGSPAARGHLSARMVGQLSAGEQFVVWALRQRLRDAAPASPVLVHGFRLAFGLWALEPALAAFEACFRLLERHPAAGGISFCPLRCACLTADEEGVLALVAEGQLGHSARSAWTLVEAHAGPRLHEHAATLGTFLARAGLTLPALGRANGPTPVH